MDEYSVGSLKTTHYLEMYTDVFLVQGSVTAPFRRTTDLLNRGETEFLTVKRATLTPLGQATSQKVMASDVMVGRTRIHFAVELTPEQAQARGIGEPPSGETKDLLPRDAYVQKGHYACTAVTGTYIIYGYCHIHEDGTLETMLRGADLFTPITHATIYMAARSNVKWQRDLVVVNRRMLVAMFLIQPEEGS